MGANIVKTSGVFALYNGMSAAILRQATYSTTRFGCYEVFKGILVKRANIDGKNTQLPFIHKIFLAGVSGGIGGFIGKR